jgi:hypothetical protein
MNFTISRLQKKRKAQPVGETAFAAACVIGFYVSLDAQNAFKKAVIWVYLRDTHYKGGPHQIGSSN